MKWEFRIDVLSPVILTDLVNLVLCKELYTLRNIIKTILHNAIIYKNHNDVSSIAILPSFLYQTVGNFTFNLISPVSSYFFFQALQASLNSNFLLDNPLAPHPFPWIRWKTICKSRIRLMDYDTERAINDTVRRFLREDIPPLLSFFRVSKTHRALILILVERKVGRKYITMVQFAYVVCWGNQWGNRMLF